MKRNTAKFKNLSPEKLAKIASKTKDRTLADRLWEAVGDKLDDRSFARLCEM